MAVAQSNPVNLTTVPKFPAPHHSRNFSRSRSPSRSPVRKAQFAARELDPLLKNLSPDSTLEALQETNALGGSQAEQNAIAQSISDASEAERRLGVRAAIAAKKLREWTEEVTSWSWPSSQDRGWGAGFVPPQKNDTNASTYLGSLPKEVVQQYEERLDEIWDAIEALGMDDIKDYVFSSHHPQSVRAPSVSMSRMNPSAYGRMRDFTALITATVIQALPVLANLRLLLDTWSIRLTVLRQIPDLLTALEQVKLGLATVNEIVQNETKNRKLNKKELETGKVIFGNKVSNLGRRVDDMLDSLEGQEDSLPQAWIDSLEDIENKYAEWVSRAEQVVLRNQMAVESPRPEPSSATESSSPSAQTPLVTLAPEVKNELQPQTETKNREEIPKPASIPSRNESLVKRKPLLEVNPRAGSGHKRGVSELSAAESTLSGYSFEDAEINDAQATPVLPSPRISIVDNILPPPKGPVSWMTSSADGSKNLSPPRPNVLQRASTASIELVPKGHIREVMLQRSASQDMLSSQLFSHNLPQSRGIDSSSHDADTLLVQHRNSIDVLTPLAASPSPSLRVDPLSIRGRELADTAGKHPPLLPRRSSKRLSMPLLDLPHRPYTPPQARDVDRVDQNTVSAVSIPITPPAKSGREETFDDKLKNILASMPTKIRLAASSENGSSGTSSETSSRASSPTRALKLSPVKDTHTTRGSNSAMGIRVYHLKGGRHKDAAPLKLFVRAVGENGERIMVRVGGGWADLAEYLREYSLHHGGRGLSDSRLEVAGFPRGHQIQHGTNQFGPSLASKDSKTKLNTQGFDFGLNDDTEKERPEMTELETSPWRPPPVPIIPQGYALPLARTTVLPQPRSNRSTTPTSSRPASRFSTVSTTTPMITTTSSSTNGNYTPLGGAGPTKTSKRATSQTFTRAPNNEAWVEGMVSQARAVSGSYSNISHPKMPQNPVSTPTTPGNVVQSPTTTTITTIVSSKPGSADPRSRRSSNVTATWSTMPAPTPSPINSINSMRPSAASSPQGSQLSSTSSGSSAAGSASKTAPGTSGIASEKRKSIMSLGDVGGIKRVFLRRKSGKQ